MAKRIDESCVRCYRKTIAGRRFETEQSADGQWALYEVINHRHRGEIREYWNHFVYKREAWHAANSVCRGEA